MLSKSDPLTRKAPIGEAEHCLSNYRGSLQNWDAVHYMVELILKGRDYFAQRRTILTMLYAFLLLAIRNRLVDKLVERCTLLGGADGSHDWIAYDVAILIDDIRCREREQI